MPVNKNTIKKITKTNPTKQPKKTKKKRNIPIKKNKNGKLINTNRYNTGIPQTTIKQIPTANNNRPDTSNRQENIQAAQPINNRQGLLKLVIPRKSTKEQLTQQTSIENQQNCENFQKECVYQYHHCV